LPWRSEQVKLLMIHLDRLRAQREEESQVASNAPPVRARRRPAIPRPSNLPHRTGLPIGCYNRTWLAPLLGHEAHALNTSTLPVIRHFVEIIKTL
jgi:hypothetical protein